MFIVFLITLLFSFFSIGFYLGTSRTFNKIFNSALLNKASEEERAFEIVFGKRKVITKILSIEEGASNESN